MNKFYVSKNPEDINPTSSTSLITDNLNEAAKKMGLYDKFGLNIHYDTIGNDHGQRVDYFITCYELLFPKLIVDNLAGRKLLTLSKDNLFFATGAGYPVSISDYFLLGVDSKKFEYVYKKNKVKNFRWLVIGESTSRGCLELIVTAFCKAFNGFKDVELYLKDRGATSLFKIWVKGMAVQNNVNIIHDDIEVSQDKLIEISASCDAVIHLNRSSTGNQRLLEQFSMGMPIITNFYCGAAEYATQDTAMPVKYDLVEYTDQKIRELESIGLRNYLFRRNMHHTIPYWSEPSVKHLSEQLLELMENPELRDKLSKNSRIIAEKFQWEKSVMAISAIVK